jgi:Protein required for biogenesis of the 60S ribosomal subunit
LHSQRHLPERPKEKKDQSKTYYHLKDVNFLAHEQLLSKFREIDAWLHKLRKARIKKDLYKADQIQENIPKYSLHHLLKERYPRFTDAIHDLDDALSLICLFASCPSNKDLKICN